MKEMEVTGFDNLISELASHRLSCMVLTEIKSLSSAHTHRGEGTTQGHGYYCEWETGKGDVRWTTIGWSEGKSFRSPDDESQLSD